MRTNYKRIYRQTKQLLLQPTIVWSEVLKENTTFKCFLRDYLFPVAGILSLFIFMLHLLQYPFLQALRAGIVNFISTICSIWFTFILSREYLCRKLNYSEQETFPLVAYSCTIFIIFHSIGHTLENMFIGQIFTLLSFSFLRTLYLGIKQLDPGSAKHQANILIITALSIIFIPIIITQILTIVFGISAINI